MNFFTMIRDPPQKLPYNLKGTVRYHDPTMTTFATFFLKITFRKFSIAAKYSKSSDGAKDIVRSAVGPRICPRVGLPVLQRPALTMLPGIQSRSA